MTAASPVRVLYIGGEGRSGSTVLERLLAATPGACGVGELKFLFSRGIGDGELCGCGQPVVACELWSKVGDQLVGGWDTPGGRDLVTFFRDINRPARLPEVLVGHSGRVRRARQVLADLYPLVAELTGTDVIVDSSKHPGWAYLLWGVDTVDLRVIHLVRHPSAVACSWSRPTLRPQAAAGDGDRYMPAQPAWEVALRWDIFNVLFHELGRRGVPTVRLRYEDYVEDLDGTVARCLALASLTPAARPGPLPVGHGIAGNPSRFAPEGVAITRDERWLEDISSADHRLVSTLTWPLRLAYGYRADRSRYLAPFRAAGQVRR